MFNRGHELTVDTYSDRPMTNQFQGNMADICPVGAPTGQMSAILPWNWLVMGRSE